MDGCKYQSKKVYLVSQKIESDIAEHYQQVMKNHFENPNEYLKEDCNEIIVGKKSNKPRLANTLQGRDTQLSQINYKGRRNLRGDINIILSMSKLPNINDINSNHLANEDSAESNMNYLSTNRSNNLKSFSRMASLSIKTTDHYQNPKVANLQRSKCKFEWEYLDTNQLNEYIKIIEDQFKSNASSQIAFEPEFFQKCVQKEQSKFQRDFASQEIKLKSFRNKEIEDQHMSDRLSIQMKQDTQEKLLIKKSADNQRRRVEEIENFEQMRDILAGESYDDWKNKLRSDHNSSQQLKLKNNKLSIWSTLSFGVNSNMEIIRKPDISLPSGSKAATIKDLKKSVVQSNKLMTSTKYKLGNFSFNNTKSRTIDQKELDFKSISLSGEDLLKVEKKNAMSIKGKKIALRNLEKGKFEEEMILCHYSDNIIKHPSQKE